MMGMMHGGKCGVMGMMGKGMMGQGMMAGMERGEDQGGMGMMGHGGKGMMGCPGGEHGMGGRYRELMGRIDLLEARMAKMETLLERLIQR